MEDTKILPTFAPAIRQGAIAQLVEQRTENPCVPGSIPGGTTCVSNRNVAELVAHYVRDVGGGRSSSLFPTKRKSSWTSFFVFSHIQKNAAPKERHLPLFLLITKYFLTQSVATNHHSWNVERSLEDVALRRLSHGSVTM